MPNWFHEIYVKNAAIYQPVLEAGLKTAPDEARGLSKIFSKYGVKKGSRVLDVSCGIGRHSINLAKLGYEVVGYDLSPYFLRTARNLAKKARAKNIRFVQGDTSNLSKILGGESKFDAIICMDSSFMRDKRSEEIALLRAMRKLAKEKCILVIETFNRELYIKQFQHFWIQSFPRNIERHSFFQPYDHKKKRYGAEWRFYKRQRDKSLKHLLSLRFEARAQSKEDLKSLVGRTGWRCLRNYGSVSRLERFSPDSFHIVMICGTK